MSAGKKRSMSFESDVGKRIGDDREDQEQPDEGADGRRCVANDRRQPEREQTENEQVEPAAEHGADDARIRERGGGCLPSEYLLADEERREGDELAHDQRDGPEGERPWRRGRACDEVRRRASLGSFRVLNSALTTSTPSTPIASWANRRPARLERVGSKASCAACVRLDHLDACAEVTTAPRPIPTNAVTRRVQTVERTDTSFVHSERSTPRKR